MVIRDFKVLKISISKAFKSLPVNVTTYIDGNPMMITRQPTLITEQVENPRYIPKWEKRKKKISAIVKFR